MYNNIIQHHVCARTRACARACACACVHVRACAHVRRHLGMHGAHVQGRSGMTSAPACLACLPARSRTAPLGASEVADAANLATSLASSAWVGGWPCLPASCLYACLPACAGRLLPGASPLVADSPSAPHREQHTANTAAAQLQPLPAMCPWLPCHDGMEHHIISSGALRCAASDGCVALRCVCCQSSVIIM